MEHIPRYPFIAAHSRYFILSGLILVVCIQGCTVVDTEDAVPEIPSVQSLLLVTPYIGDETEYRDPLPEPEWMLMKSTKVRGWVTGVNSQLRFPVELKNSARLSFCLGAIPRVPLYGDDLRLTIEYQPNVDESLADGESPGSVVIYETTPLRHPIILEEFVYLDIPLDQLTPGRGEIRFSTVCMLEGEPEIDIMWGQPVLYHSGEDRNRNVLLIGVDTLRRDALSIYGGRSELTPNLQALSQSGTVFTRSWGQAPFTGPSFASMLTGQYTSDIRPTITTKAIPDNAEAVAEILHREGYATYMICGNPYLGTISSGFSQGMEGHWYEAHASPPQSIDLAKEYIERKQNRDWFLFLHLMDPHAPYDPPQDLIDTLCNPDYDGKYPTEFADVKDWQSIPQEMLPPEEIERARSLYDAEVADVDRAIGDLFSWLEANGFLENTLVIFTADHGEEFFDHDDFGHGQSLYEEMMHLPMIAWGPDFSPGEIDTPVANIDIVPSILRYLDIPLPEGLSGIPLQDTVSGNADADRIIFGEGNLRWKSHHKSAIEWPYKCITEYFSGATVLFDLEADPDERNDISDLYPELTERLSGEMTRSLLPIQTTIFIAIIGSPIGGPERFSGRVQVPGGIGWTTAAGFLDGDEFIVEGDTVLFDLSTRTRFIDPRKALIIYPERGCDTIEVSALADGEVDPERFFPYGTPEAEPSGSATVNVYEIPWPNRIPENAWELPAACYVLVYPGFPRDDRPIDLEQVELDRETREQLRALGYIN